MLIDGGFDPIFEDPEPNNSFSMLVSFGAGNFQVEGSLTDSSDVDWWWIEGDDVETILILLHDVVDSADVEMVVVSCSGCAVTVNKVGPDDQAWVWGQDLTSINASRYAVRIQATAAATYPVPYRLTYWTR